MDIQEFASPRRGCATFSSSKWPSLASLSWMSCHVTSEQPENGTKEVFCDFIRSITDSCARMCDALASSGLLASLAGFRAHASKKFHVRFSGCSESHRFVPSLHYDAYVILETMRTVGQHICMILGPHRIHNSILCLSMTFRGKGKPRRSGINGPTN